MSSFPAFLAFGVAAGEG
jgi:hypothetical protein